ncbi:MAG: ComEA family DNA-binding protein [Candidatus Omnitrophota bacterium]
MKEFTLDERKILIFILVALIFGLGLSWFNKTYPQKSQNLIFLPAPIIEEKNNFNPNDTNSVRRKLININTADLSALIDLPGIGEVIAKRIISFRKANGPYRQKEDLIKVKGIGPKKFEKFKNQISI